MTPPIELRVATPADLDQVLAMLRRMVEEMSAFGRDRPCTDAGAWDDVARDLRAGLESGGHVALLAGRPEVVGVVVARVDRPPPVYAPRRLLHVSAVYVDPAWRRRGLARRLLADALAWGRSQACVEARLYVMAANPAREVYRALGFDDVQVEMRLGL